MELYLAKDTRLTTLKQNDKDGTHLLCHLEKINSHNHWMGQAWFTLSPDNLTALLKEVKTA